MNNSKDRKPTRPDIQEILSRMKNRFVSGRDSDCEDHVKEENLVTTSSIVENTIKEEVPIEKSPDDEIAELMLKLNGQVDEELVASIRSQKKMYENQSEVHSTSSATNISDQTKQEKPRIILTLRPNENKPDSYVSSSNLTDYNSNNPKRKKLSNNITTEIIPLKRSSRRSNDSNQSVLKSAIARKERTFSIDVSSKKRLPKKKQKEPEEVANEVNIVSVSTQPAIEDDYMSIKNENDTKEEISEDSSITDQKKKKKKFFRGGRYNIFKRKSVQKEHKKIKKSIYHQLNSESGHFEVDSSETTSEIHSVSVCSDIGTLMSSDRNYQDDLDTNMSTVDMEDKFNEYLIDVQNKKISNCLCDESIQVVILDEGKITCKAEDCVDGKLIPCDQLAFQFDNDGNMPMLRANVTLPFLTFCAHHIKRFFLHQSCPRCGRFCSEGIFMMCKNKHFSHIGCHQKDRGCLHCGIADVHDLELKRHVIKQKKKIYNRESTSNITVKVGNIKLTTRDCPPEINFNVLSSYLHELKNEIVNKKRTLIPVVGLYQACESNDIKRFLSILGAHCNLEHKFSNYHNQTALHAACIKGNLMIVYLLLQSGVDPNVVDNKMKSPMRMAAKFGHSTIIQYLLNYGGAVELKDMQGMTSLHVAAKHGKLECCKALLNKRPSMVNWKDHGGWTPLVWACENSHSDVVKFFMSHKPNTRIPDDENNVALHWAAISGCLEVVKCLVEYDSEINMLNDTGDTALHIAARKNATDIVSFLLEKGAMAWHKNKAKKRPIDCCHSSSKCYNLLKNVPPKQRKSVINIQSFIPVDLECAKSKSDSNTNSEPSVFVKTTPVLVSEDITHGCEDTPIKCVNEIDDELPIEFTYIKENCYDVGNYVDSAMSHIASCSCEGACNTNACKCVQANGECLYDENGRLNSDFDYFNPSVIIYECNWRCKCHKQRCGNRVIQKGIKVELELYRLKDLGWGVRICHDIPRGTFVCEYIGEIITDQKANDLNEDSYLFNLENPEATELYCIDAYHYSNISRFINHSCDPNLMSVRSFINHHDKRFPRIAFFAVQDIKKNEQLSYDYGTAFWKVKSGIFTCKCGRPNCSYSDETIKNILIDSDNEDLDLDEAIEPHTTDKNEFSIDGLPNTNSFVTNNINASKSLYRKTRLSQNNNLLKLKKKHISPSSSESSLTNKSYNKKNNSKVSTSTNGLLLKNKHVGVINNKKPIKKVTKHSLDLKSCKKSQQQIISKKKKDNNMLNRNLSQANVKKVFIKQKSCVETTGKKEMCNGNIMSPDLVHSVHNKVPTTFLRTKIPSSTNITTNIITEDTIPNNVILKSNDLRKKKPVFVLSNTLSGNQKISSDKNDYDQLESFTNNKLVAEKSEINSNTLNSEHDFIDFPET